MTTVRQIEKHWNSQAYTTLLHEMLAGRTEASLRLEGELSGPVPAAAMVLLRLDELAQSYVPLYAKLLQFILGTQQSDGGWGDPLITAICLRALLAGRGQGQAIDQGMQYLANLQKPEGIWPKVPIRRLPADAFVSAFILLELGNDSRFRNAVRFDHALQWFEQNSETLDGETRRVWDSAKRRLPFHSAEYAHPQLTWS